MNASFYRDSNGTPMNHTLYANDKEDHLKCTITIDIVVQHYGLRSILFIFFDLALLFAYILILILAVGDSGDDFRVLD